MPCKAAQRFKETWSARLPGRQTLHSLASRKTGAGDVLSSAAVLALSCILFFPVSIALADDNVIEIITLQHRPADEIRDVLTPMLEGDEVIGGSGFNLIVKSPPSRQATLRRLVEQLDTPLHNLVISVLQNSHKSADELNAEAEMRISPSSIRMQGMVSDTRDLARQQTLQQVRTLEGQPAHIEAGAVRPVENVTVYDSGYGYPGVVGNTQVQEASTGFAVVPRLSGNQEVLLEIAPWSERFLNRTGLATESMQSSIRARLGEWVELGTVDSTQASDKQGFRGFNYSTRQRATYFLLKVDLAN